ncbi:hypothetical protein BSK59_22395 [Paenibacillus odorifer]|uniref:hypothetical protein n=1 Tax=Paenibacillus odorifer TaxID=189426 RepID=UPI00096EECBA|nr:hypothetical protein [Paenibacillus odorifer]OME50657.1 hypothetical protein BSK59_22395 [Paenibacillus odorifer]
MTPELIKELIAKITGMIASDIEDKIQSESNNDARKGLLIAKNIVNGFGKESEHNEKRNN